MAHLNFWGHNAISGTAEATVITFYMQLGYIRC